MSVQNRVGDFHVFDWIKDYGASFVLLIVISLYPVKYQLPMKRGGRHFLILWVSQSHDHILIFHHDNNIDRQNIDIDY